MFSTGPVHNTVITMQYSFYEINSAHQHQYQKDTPPSNPEAIARLQSATH
jgi:hypothetical protein